MSNHFPPNEKKKGGWVSTGKDRRDEEKDSCKNTFNTLFRMRENVKDSNVYKSAYM